MKKRIIIALRYVFPQNFLPAAEIFQFHKKNGYPGICGLPLRLMPTGGYSLIPVTIPEDLSLKDKYGERIKTFFKKEFPGTALQGHERLKRKNKKLRTFLPDAFHFNSQKIF